MNPPIVGSEVSLAALRYQLTGERTVDIVSGLPPTLRTDTNFSMTHSRFLTAFMAILVWLTLVMGCATSPDAPDAGTQGLESDRADRFAQAWVALVLDYDFDRALTYVSEEFASAQFPDADALQTFFRAAETQRLFKEATLRPSAPGVWQRAEGVRVYPLIVESAMGQSTFDLVVRREQEKWTVVRLFFEQY